jgi:hypothetical protein
MLAGMSNWVTPDGFLSSTPGMPGPGIPALTNSHAGPAVDPATYVIAAGVIAVLIIAVVWWSVGRHVGVALGAGRWRVAVRDRAATRANAP